MFAMQPSRVVYFTIHHGPYLITVPTTQAMRSEIFLGLAALQTINVATIFLPGHSHERRVVIYRMKNAVLEGAVAHAYR